MLEPKETSYITMSKLCKLHCNLQNEAKYLCLPTVELPGVSLLPAI